MRASLLFMALVVVGSFANAACSDDETDNFWKKTTTFQRQVCRLERLREYGCIQTSVRTFKWSETFTGREFFRIYKGDEVVAKVRDADKANAKLDELCVEHTMFGKFSDLITMAGSCSDDRSIRSEMRGEAAKLPVGDLARTELMKYFRKLNARELCAAGADDSSAPSPVTDNSVAPLRASH